MGWSYERLCLGLDVDGCSTSSQGLGCRLEDCNDASAIPAVGQRLFTCRAGVHERGELFLERLPRRHLWDDDVAVADHGAVLPKLRPTGRLRDGVITRSLIENLQLFVDRDVVENDHLSIAHGRDTPHLVRI